MKLHQIIQALASESSTKAKSAILTRFKDREDLRLYFKYTLDPFINYFIKAKMPDTAGNDELTINIMEKVVSTLGGRILTGNAARDFLMHEMETLTREDQVLMFNMIKHDPNCKVSFGLVDKCWPGMIKEFPCMLAETYNEKTASNMPEGHDLLIVQKKEDGGRVAIVVDKQHQVTVYSRNGNILETHGVFDALFSKFPGKVFDGELLVIDDRGVADRKSGNGIFNKAVRGTVSPEEASTFHAVLWDVIELDRWETGFDDTPYKERLTTLVNALSSLPSHRASLVESKIISTHAEAQKFYEQMVEAGHEGAMLKIASMPWENRRSKNVLKLKECKDATLKCVGVQPHSKNPMLIGSLDCVTSCGQLMVSVGSGLGDKERNMKPSEFIGKLIDIQYNMVIEKKGSTTKSLFLPRFMRIRLDRNSADTLEHINNQ